MLVVCCPGLTLYDSDIGLGSHILVVNYAGLALCWRMSVLC